MFWSIIGLVLIIVLGFWFITLSFNVIMWLLIALFSFIVAIIGWFVRKVEGK